MNRTDFINWSNVARVFGRREGVMRHDCSTERGVSLLFFRYASCLCLLAGLSIGCGDSKPQVIGSERSIEELQQKTEQTEEAYKAAMRAQEAELEEARANPQGP